MYVADGGIGNPVGDADRFGIDWQPLSMLVDAIEFTMAGVVDQQVIFLGESFP